MIFMIKTNSRKIFTIPLLFGCMLMFGQDACEDPQRVELLNGRIGANIFNDATLFRDDYLGGFKYPYNGNESNSTILNAAIWLGGFDDDGYLKISAGSKKTGINGYVTSDYVPGPLDPLTGNPYADIPCHLFNQIWTVTQEEVHSFLADWNTNQFIDHEHPSIYAWPGNGNPHFLVNGLPSTDEGWAPFFDRDENGIYDPDKGDFPLITNNGRRILPKEMAWTVFNDQTEHAVSYGYGLNFEVQQLAWTLECESQPEIENTVFLDYKVINRGNETFDSLQMGMRVDFSIGCPYDDYLASLPDLDAFLVYNKTQEDDEAYCFFSVPSYGETSPVMSVKLLQSGNRYSGVMDYFTYYVNPIEWTQNMQRPTSPEEYYNYLTGTWQDGTPLTKGGNGYNPNSTDVTTWAYAGNPNQAASWSMLSDMPPVNATYTGIGTTTYKKVQDGPASTFEIGGVWDVSYAFTVHNEPSLGHIGIIDKLVIDDLPNLELAYFDVVGINGFYCYNHSDADDNNESNINEEEGLQNGIYPNPTSGKLTISLSEAFIEEVEVYNTAWQLIFSDKERSEDLKVMDLSFLAQGIYVLRIKIDGHYIFRKVVKY